MIEIQRDILAVNVPLEVNYMCLYGWNGVWAIHGGARPDVDHGFSPVTIHSGHTDVDPSGRNQF